MVKLTSKRSHIILNIFIAINILTIAAYLLTCLIPFVNPGKFWFISFLGLGFPLIAFTLLGFVILWIFFKSKWAWLSLLTLVIGYQQLDAAFAFHLPHEFSKSKQENTIRILQYNVAGEESVRQALVTKKKYNITTTLSFIKNSNADILTFQEFYTRFDEINSTISMIDSLGYPYYYIATRQIVRKKKYVGTAIFSKFPIVDTATISLGSDPKAMPLIYADIKVDGKNYRVFTTHLQSIGIDRAEYKSIDASKYGNSTEIKVDRSVAGKLKRAYQSRYDQSLIIREQINQSPYPVIVGGDFNDVPNSNTYFTIKGKLQDAFLKKGSFIGRTFRYISPTLRIDFIFADPIFKVSQFTIPSVTFSDHFPVITDLQYP